MSLNRVKQVADMDFMEQLTTVISIIEENALIYPYLKSCPYEILGCWKVKTFQKGEPLIQQGEKCNDFYLLDKGLVDVNVVSTEGKHYSHAIYKEGNYLGELEIFEQREYCCNAVALTTVRALQLSRADFLRWLDLDRNIQQMLLHNVCTKFYALSTKAAVDSFYSLKYRLCEFLLQCIRRHNYMDSQQQLMIRKAELSSYLAVTSRSVNRVVMELRNKGIVDTRKGYLTVCDVQLLEKELRTTKK